MRRHLKILSFFIGLLLITNISMGQDVHVQLKNAVESKNVKTFSKLFDERIEITIDGESQDYSQQQAQVVLNKFLANSGKTNFELIHSGVSKNQSKYYIGKMETNGGVYQVYVYFKRINNADFVQEIKFEKQTN